MIEEFIDTTDSSAHAAFQAWRTEHQRGVFLTLETRTRATLHGTRCQHLGAGPPYYQLDDGFGSLTSSRKICGAQSELLAWAAANAIAIKRCQHCTRDLLLDAPDDPTASRFSTDSELLDRERRIAEQAGTFDPSSITDARERVLAAIVRRQGQPAFRARLLELYSRTCAFSGCTVEHVLDAAHIEPYKGPDTNHPQNGLLLRTDIHTLFDLGFLTVDTRTMTIVVDRHLSGTEYERLGGKQVAAPSDPSCAPSSAALDAHRKRAG